jgi:hypothetical protein
MPKAIALKRRQNLVEVATDFNLSAMAVTSSGWCGKRMKGDREETPPLQELLSERYGMKLWSWDGRSVFTFLRTFTD